MSRSLQQAQNLKKEYERLTETVPLPPPKSNAPRTNAWLPLAALGCVVLLCVTGVVVTGLLAATGRLNVQFNLLPATSTRLALGGTPTATSFLNTPAPTGVETFLPTDLATIPPIETLLPPSTAATPTVVGTPTIPELKLAWDADFILSCDLFVGDNEVRKYGCENNEYVMLNKQATTRYSYWTDTYEDAFVEGQGHWVSGEGAYEYGIVWRADEGGTLYYVFVVTSEGKYNVARYQNEKYTDLIPYTASPLVNKGTTPNRFQVLTRGSQFDFWLNQEYIGSVSDSNIKSGRVGLFFYNSKPNVKVAFDRLAVSTVEEETVPLTPSPIKPTDQPTYLAWSGNFTTGCDLFVGENEVRKYSCENGKYVMQHKQATTRYAYIDTVYDDSVVFAQGRWVSGTGAHEYGIVFRANTDGTVYYVFTVTGDGKYDVAVFKDDKYTYLIPYTASPIVKTGTETNRFQVVARGNQLYFYLNDQYIGQVTDATIARGNTGIFFYNEQPNAEVAFDALTVWTFTPTTPNAPVPTATTSLATPVATAARTIVKPTVPPVVGPGVYVARIRMSPSAPKRGQPVTFFVTFINTSGKTQGYRWLVEIWEADTNKRNPFGQADGRQQNIPVSTNELATSDSWRLTGGGPCMSFRARVVFENNQGQRVPFKQTNGTDFWLPFQVCP